MWGAVDVRIEEDTDFAVTQIVEIDVVVDAVRINADRYGDIVNLIVANKRSRSDSHEFKTLPRSGKMVWNSLSRPIFAEPPAESPRLRIIH